MTEAASPLVSEWTCVDQTMVDRFADAIDDHQFIHVDPVRARAETAYGGTIVHGFYLSSMLTAFARSALPPAKPGAVEVNYGFDKLRFLTPVPVGSRLRGSFTLASETPKAGGMLRNYAVRVEIDGSDRPALAANWLVLTVGD
ncbi:MaoC family dehydratase [Martelella sp. AD-3]|uniref:MaoC family dehydratase n=1 Tax=Martelella sp. AD-3 TaxID=686597 RepID=UPI000466A944|nr:MaoC family dehydratase [Martelella sp. AD-3]AMM87211.1 nodulation protein NodN [Martelella sp. AD-3]MAM10198.1 nodulation protein NodN [Rhizobiaceae bacterium]|tara:strand:- start:84 stop:512 length:429 start_codon:yes stop_codon:yes gene_type:complete